MSDSPCVTFIVPAYQEAASIGQVVQHILRVERSIGCEFELLVIDDGSRDETARLACEAGARVLRYPYNRGKGAELKTGIRAARGETNRPCT